MDENFEFTEDIIRCLRNKFLPLKYAYIKTAAEYHTKFAQSENYDSAVAMAEEGYRFILNYLEEKINYVEIGADDGVKSMKLIELLRNENVKINNFYFLDFSEELLGKCRKTMTDQNLICDYIRCDVENLENLPRFDNSNLTLFVFIGNTLGNMEDEKKVLKNFSSMMGDTDYLLLGVTLRNDDSATEQELQAYSNVLFTDSVLAFLDYIGIKTIRDNFTLFYDKETNMIIGEYKILEPFIWANETILDIGDRVRCFQSKRFEFNECKELFSAVNLNIENYYIDSNERHIVFLLKKF